MGRKPYLSHKLAVFFLCMEENGEAEGEGKIRLPSLSSAHVSHAHAHSWKTRLARETRRVLLLHDIVFTTLSVPTGGASQFAGVTNDRAVPPRFP